MVKESSTHPWLSQIDTSSLPPAQAATLVNAYRRLIGNCRETTRIDRWLWINTYENTIFNGMNIHKSQLFWGSLGTRVLTHPQIVTERERETQSLNHLSIHQWVRSAFCHTVTHLSYSCPIFETGAALCRTLSCWCSKLVGSWPRTWRYGNAGVLNQLFGTND